MLEDVNSHLTGKLKTWRLGLDIGSNSLGWAAIDRKNRTIISGVRIFPEGLELKKGKEESRAASRRLARQVRRQGERRRRRWKQVARCLIECGLLPSDKSNTNDDPYLLRRKAIHEKLEPFDIGRAIYHLQKRRGFRSGLKDLAGMDEKEQEGLKGEISSLQQEIVSAGKTTLGEYLAELDPHKDRTRNRYLGRDMVETEFHLIWDFQKKHYPDLMTDENKEKVHHGIFFQRPLKSQKNQIGFCPLEPDKKRLSRASWLFQKFRLYQEVNNLSLVHVSGKEEPLDDLQWEKIIARLSTTKADVKFETIRKDLKLSDEYRFNLEGGDRLKINTDIVEATLSKHFKLRWKNEKDTLRSYWDKFLECEGTGFEEFLVSENAKFDEADKKIFLELLRKTPDRYGSYSQEAIERLLPHLQERMQLTEALDMEYPDRNRNEEITDFLPPVDSEKIINPNVRRALSETRKVINSLIREFGKPERIIIEMARENKGSAATRARKNIKMRQNEKQREIAEQELIKKGITPTPRQIRKYILWEECKHVCPYTGKRISFENLFGKQPEFEIEHILPYSRSMDNSFLNLSLCEKSENAGKGNRTPYEAYHQDTVQLSLIQQRVEKTGMPYEKRRRFFLKEIPEDFKERQLRDTSYAAKELGSYLKQLGEGIVSTTKGPVTANLRRCLGLNTILSFDTLEKKKGGKKERLDHRHHAVDAIAIALTNQPLVEALGQEEINSAFTFPEPWKGFHSEAQRSIDAINVSHRVNHKLNAGFSKDTNYGLKTIPILGKKTYVQRVNLDSINEKQAERICDPIVKKTVINAINNSKDDKAWYEDLRLPAKNGRGPLIKKVRIFETKKNLPRFEKNGSVRHVETGDNHHLAIYKSELNGKTTYLPWVATRLEAMQRLEHNKKNPDDIKPVIAAVHPDKPEAGLVLWLMINDSVLWTDDMGQKSIYRVQSISGPPKAKTLELMLRLHTETKVELRIQPVCLRLTSLNPIKIEYNRTFRIQKITVDPIGRIFPCHDAPNH